MSDAPHSDRSSRPLASLKKKSDADVLILPPEEVPPASNAPPEPVSVKVATFNILFDMYEADLIYSDKRVPQVAKELESLSADIIGLQEVSAKALADIRLGSGVLSREYYFACLPSDMDYSQALLSRFPILDAVACRMSRFKRCIFYELLLPSGLHVVVCNVHLISAFSGDNGPARRIEELEFVFSSLAPFDCAIVMGDFNFGDNDPEQAVFPWPKAFVDCSGVKLSTPADSGKNAKKLLWKDRIAMHLSTQRADVASVLDVTSSAFTFDLSRNPLADLMSHNVRQPRRLDRVIVKGFGILQKAKLFSDKPFAWRSPVTRGGEGAQELPPLLCAQAHVDGMEPMFPSDHFGVACVLSVPSRQHTQTIAEDCAAQPQPVVRPPSKGQTSFRSALVVVIPSAFHGVINEYRAVHDKAYPRWMPHITILFPFVPVADFHVAAAVLQQKFKEASCKPFKVQLSRSGSFSRGKAGAVLFLDPQASSDEASSGQGLATIYSVASELFPWCGRDVGEGQEFHPHVTLGQFSRQQERQVRAAIDNRLAAMPDKFEFDVSGVQLIAHLDGEDGYRVLEEVLF